MDNPNKYTNQKIRGLKRKYEAIIFKGGKCEICGYNHNISALDFHHINPSTKLFQLDIHHFANTRIDILNKELDKCQLLCANCHREIHNPGLNMNEINEVIEDSNKSSFITPKKMAYTKCKCCGKLFTRMKGKIYCSPECRLKDKRYPSCDEVNQKYLELNSWEKVAEFFGLTRKIIQGIRKTGGRSIG